MPFLHRIINRPANGRTQELRQLLTERVKARQGDGFRVGLAQVLWGSDAPEFLIQFIFEHLAEREKLDAANARDSAGFFAKLAELTAGPAHMELWEVALTAQPGPGKYVRREHFTPGVGLAGQLRAALVENARLSQAEGVRVSMLASLSGPARLEQARFYSDLDSLEAAQVEPPSAAVIARRQRATPLFGAVVATSIAEILVPFAPA